MVLAGRCGLAENDFWNMTMRYFYNYTKGWEANRREAWEQARLVGYHAVLAPRLDRRKKIKITDLCLFEWEGAAGQNPSRLNDKEKSDMLAIMQQWRQDAAIKKANNERGNT